jgi:acyl carrier protein
MQVETQLKQFLLKNLQFVEDETLDDDASFLETGVVDSTGVMELVAFVQTEFGVPVEQSEIVVENFDSVRKLARFVRRKLAVPEEKEAASEQPEVPEPLVISGR